MRDVFAVNVGMRYLFVGTSGFSKLVNSVSIVGLALGIMLMIVVSSVHNGLADERRVRLLRVVPHAFLNQTPNSAEQLERIQTLNEVEAIRREFHGLAIIRGLDIAPITVSLIGVDLSAAGALDLEFAEGELGSDAASKGIAVPYALANRLGLNLGEALELTFVSPTPTALETRTANFRIEATFRFSTELDANTVFVGLAALTENTLHRTGKLGWNISVVDPFSVEATFAREPNVVTWIDDHGGAFRAYQLERVAMYILMTFVLMLASFNIIAGQAMLINVKRADIAILVTMGATRRQLLGAFAIQGGAITLVGVLAGLVLGLAIAFNINVIFDMFDDWLGISILEQTAFSELPARVAPWDVVGAVLIATSLGVLALIKPLRLALKESPVHVLNRAG